MFESHKYDCDDDRKANAVEGLATQSGFLKTDSTSSLSDGDDGENKFGFWLQHIGAHLACIRLTSGSSGSSGIWHLASGAYQAHLALSGFSDEAQATILSWD